MLLLLRLVVLLLVWLLRERRVDVLEDFGVDDVERLHRPSRPTSAVLSLNLYFCSYFNLSAAAAITPQRRLSSLAPILSHRISRSIYVGFESLSRPPLLVDARMGRPFSRARQGAYLLPLAVGKSTASLACLALCRQI
jgi:hypothetical protein